MGTAATCIHVCSKCPDFELSKDSKVQADFQKGHPQIYKKGRRIQEPPDNDDLLIEFNQGFKKNSSQS